jgi:hypothetical protein
MYVSSHPHACFRKPSIVMWDVSPHLICVQPVCMHACMHAQTHTHAHTHIHIYTHNTHAHSHTHTHIQPVGPPPESNIQGGFLNVEHIKTPPPLRQCIVPCISHRAWREDWLEGTWVSYWLFGHEVVRISRSESGSPVGNRHAAHGRSSEGNAILIGCDATATREQSNATDAEDATSLHLGDNPYLLRVHKETARRSEVMFVIDTRTGAAYVQNSHYNMQAEKGNYSEPLLQAVMEPMSRDKFAISWCWAYYSKKQIMRMRVLFKRAQPSSRAPEGSFFGVLWHAMEPGLERPPAV